MRAGLPVAQKTGARRRLRAAFRRQRAALFIVTFLIMLPITIKTGDPMKGWAAGLVWVFLPEFHSDDRRLHRAGDSKDYPRAALLGTLAGVSVTFHSRCGRRLRCT